MFLVVACPRCRHARVVEQGKKTASCGSCPNTLQVEGLRVAFLGGSLAEAQEAAGRLNAKLQGREEEYLAALLLAKPAAARQHHDDRWNAAAAAARNVSGEVARADAIARALREFDDQDLLKAATLAGLRDPARQLRRMLETQVVYEPKPGLYRAL